MLAPTWLFDHVTTEPAGHPLAVSVTDWPKQTDVVEAVIEGVAGRPTLISQTADGALTQAPNLQMAVYEAVADGVNVMLAPVAPVLQTTSPLQPWAVSVTASPGQTVVDEHTSVGAVTLVVVIVTALDTGLVHVPVLHTAV